MRCLMKLVYSFLVAICLLVPVIAQTHAAPLEPMRAMTAEKWRGDLKFMAAEIERVHKNAFHKVSWQEFAAAVTLLDSRIPSLEDLIGRNQFDDAVEVFKLNVEMHPRSANVYDSLGEAYLKKGDKTNALSSYKKALEIDPTLRTAVEAVRTLSQE